MKRIIYVLDFVCVCSKCQGEISRSSGLFEKELRGQLNGSDTLDPLYSIPVKPKNVEKKVKQTRPQLQQEHGLVKVGDQMETAEPKFDFPVAVC